MLSWSIANRYREGPNPARWEDNLEHLLPSREAIAKVKHHAALPYVQIHDFMTQLALRDGFGARALEFLILTAARTGEVTGAVWDEIDLPGKTWTIPASRMKMEKEHKVPLSDRAVKILKSLPRESDFVFPGGRKGTAISNAAMAAVIDRMNDDNTQHGRPRYTDPKENNRDITPHGFRSSFRDWAGETTSYPHHILETALAHAISSAVEKAYSRGDLFAKRVHLMSDWAKFCATEPVVATDNVIQMHGQA